MLMFEHNISSKAWTVTQHRNEDIKNINPAQNLKSKYGKQCVVAFEGPGRRSGLGFDRKQLTI